MPLLAEALEYKDMEGMIKPTVHVDEFASKMGDDEDIIVISFYIRSDQAARDLMSWFEKGYDWVLDADRSPGEIRPGRYLVYVEMRRRSTAGEKVAHMIEDLETLCEHTPSDWSMTYDGKVYPFDRDTFDRLIPLSPRAYREQRDQGLNEMRSAAGLDVITVKNNDPTIQKLQSAAGI